MVKTKKRYTRKQVEQTIKHWKKVLESMILSEKMNELIKKSITAFSSDITNSKDSVFQLNHDRVVTLYGILNETVFENKLKLPLIQLMPISKLQARHKDAKNVYASYLHVFDPVSHSIKAESIEIVSDKGSFANIASCLCHEMIHQFLVHYTNLIDLEAEAYKKNGRINSHENQIFVDKMKYANSLGLNVKKYVERNSMTDMNLEAADHWNDTLLSEEELKTLDSIAIRASEKKQLEKIANGLYSAIENPDLKEVYVRGNLIAVREA